MYSDESGHSESEFLLSVGRDFEPNGAYKSLSQLKKEEITYISYCCLVLMIQLYKDLLSVSEWFLFARGNLQPIR